MKRLGQFGAKNPRSTFVGNNTHIFGVIEVAPEVRDNDKSDGSQDSDEDEESDPDTDDSASVISSDSEPPPDEDFEPAPRHRAKFDLCMFDRHSMELVKTLGTFSRGNETRVQIYENILMVIDVSHSERAC